MRESERERERERAQPDRDRERERVIKRGVGRETTRSPIKHNRIREERC